ncbi:MAG: alpha/beta fold hydrolase [Myxococcota bacterium]
MLLLTASVTSCAFSTLGRDLQELEGWGVIRGTLDPPATSDRPILVAAFQTDESQPWAVDHVHAYDYLSGPREFALVVPEGEYFLWASEDPDRNGEMRPGERYALHPEPVSVGPELPEPHVALELDHVFTGHEPEFENRIVEEQLIAAGEVASLDDPRFQPENARTHFWHPLEALEHGAVGVFYLEEYDPQRTPVLFVHGILGTASDFAWLTEHLSPERHQFWVAQYPSALPLDITAETFAFLVSELHAFHRYEQLCVVAHSMGGLVARRMMDHIGTGVPVTGLATIASPLEGVGTARVGARWAPVAAPSWVDVAPGSAFLESLYDTPLDPTTHYRMLFTYLPGRSGDGVVQTASQLREEAQREAGRIRGIRDTHTGVLANEATLESLTDFLERCGR